MVNPSLIYIYVLLGIYIDSNKSFIMKRFDSSVREREVVTKTLKKYPTRTLFKVGPWSIDEHKKFLKGIKSYGNSWKEVQQLVKTRSCSQVRVHFIHYMQKLRTIIRQKIYNDVNYGATLITFHNYQPESLNVKQINPKARLMEKGAWENLVEEREDLSEVVEHLLSEELEVTRANEGRQEEVTSAESYNSWDDIIAPLEHYYLTEYLKGNLSLGR